MSAANACNACPGTVIIDTARHAEWHALIAPLTAADAVTLERAYGRPSVPIRTYIDDQFDAVRAGLHFAAKLPKERRHR